MTSMFVDTTTETSMMPPLTPATPSTQCVSLSSTTNSTTTCTSSAFTFHSCEEKPSTPRVLSRRRPVSLNVQLPPPSPSKSCRRLDPQYANRLLSSPKSHSSNQHNYSYHTPDRSSSRRKHRSHDTSSPSSCMSHSSTREFQVSDRFIPSRAASNLNFSVWDNPSDSSNHDNSNEATNESNNNSNVHISNTESNNQLDGDSDSPPNEQQSQHSQSQQQPLFNVLLRSELLGENFDPSEAASSSSKASSSPSSHYSSSATSNFLRYQNTVREMGSSGPTSIVDAFKLSPVGSAATHRMFFTPQKQKRRIAKVPFKVLDAPALQDDFYLNLVDWSSLNVLAVGLGSCVYLWSACTSKVTKLCDLASSEDLVTSVNWAQRGTHLAVGTNRGEVQLWDTIKCKKLRTMGGHSARIGTLAWNGPTLASGSRDRQIYLRDVRVQQSHTAHLSSHKQEVCGLKWSFDEPAKLASGGNDNKLLVWDIKKHAQPLYRFAKHTAAVKAIAWSPHQHGLLASGGGTADRCIRFWNALSGTSLSCVDTGSQVCNLAWSQNCNEIVSTHGYSLNQIAVWKYPTMQKVATLTGHTYRVLYLALSPDGSTIVTGAGDETLRFWQVFPGPRSHDKTAGNGLLFPNSPGSVVR